MWLRLAAHCGSSTTSKARPPEILLLLLQLSAQQLVLADPLLEIGDHNVFSRKAALNRGSIAMLHETA